MLDADVDIEIAYETLVGTGCYITQALAADAVDAPADRLCALLLRGIRQKENRDERRVT